MAAANPILGVGFNGFNKSYNQYDFLYGYYGKNRSVHSSWFGVLAELGYTGFALYVAILIMAVVACQQVATQAKTGKAPPELYYYAVAIQTGFAVCAVGGSFVAWQYCEMLWHFVGLSMGLRTVVFMWQPETQAIPDVEKAAAPVRGGINAAFRPVSAARSVS